MCRTYDSFTNYCYVNEVTMVIEKIIKSLKLNFFGKDKVRIKTHCVNEETSLLFSICIDEFLIRVYFQQVLANDTVTCFDIKGSLNNT